MLRFLVFLSSAGSGEGKTISALQKITAKFIEKHCLIGQLMNPVGVWVLQTCQLFRCRRKPPSFERFVQVSWLVKLLSCYCLVLVLSVASLKTMFHLETISTTFKTDSFGKVIHSCYWLLHHHLKNMAESKDNEFTIYATNINSKRQPNKYVMNLLFYIYFLTILLRLNYSFLVTKIQEYNYFQGHPATAVSETTWSQVSQVFCIFTSTLKTIESCSLVPSYFHREDASISKVCRYSSSIFIRYITVSQCCRHRGCRGALTFTS